MGQSLSISRFIIVILIVSKKRLHPKSIAIELSGCMHGHPSFCIPYIYRSYEYIAVTCSCLSQKPIVVNPMQTQIHSSVCTHSSISAWSYTSFSTTQEYLAMVHAYQRNFKPYMQWNIAPCEGTIWYEHVYESEYWRMHAMNHIQYRLEEQQQWQYSTY